MEDRNFSLSTGRPFNVDSRGCVRRCISGRRCYQRTHSCNRGSGGWRHRDHDLFRCPYRYDHHRACRLADRRSRHSPDHFPFPLNVDAKNGFASIDAVGGGSDVYHSLTVSVPTGFIFTDLIFDTLKATQVSVLGSNGGTYSNDDVKTGLDEFTAVATGALPLLRSP
jgi:hypothetical protein